MRLKHRIAATLFVLQAILVVAVTGALHVFAERQFATHAAIAADVHLEHLANLSRAALLTEDYAELQIFIEEATRDPRIEDVVVLDVFGRAVASTLSGLVGLPFSGFGEVAADAQERRHEVRGYGQPLGTVVARFTSAPLREGLNSAVRRTYLVGLAGIALSGLIAWLLGRWLAARLDALARASAAVARGEPFRLPPLAGAAPELRQLADAIALMVGQLRGHAAELARSRDQLIIPTEAMAQGFALWDEAGRLSQCNARVGELLGVPPERLPRGLQLMDWAQLLAAHDPLRTAADVVAMRCQARRAGRCSVALTLAGERSVEIEESLTRSGGVVTIVTDVTEQRRHAAAIARNERRLELLMRCVLEGLLVVDRSGRILNSNPAAAAMMGVEAEALAGVPVTERLWTRPSVARLLAEGASRSPLLEGEVRRGDGSVLPIEMALVPAGLDEPEVVFVGLRDISARRRAEAELRFAASHDRLTGVVNHSEMQARVNEAVERGAVAGTRVALLFLDLDGFKLINDTHGHVVGDGVLREVAHRLRAAVAETGLVGRLGGDEFGVLLTAPTALRAVTALAGEILAALREPHGIADRTIDIGASIGIAVYPDHGADGADLVRAADVALYDAKKAGGFRWRLYKRHQAAGMRHRLTVAQRLHHALDRGEFHLAYQPQFDFRTGRITGFEALLRWTSGVFGTMPPDAFIPIAEETGQILPIGRWVLARAVEDLEALRAAGGTGLRMAVNVSPRQLDEVGFARAALDLIAGHTGEVVIELTERVLMTGVGRTRRHLDTLSEAGVGLVLDDFGTGYSSLNHLRHFRIGEVKIDRSFIADLLADEADAQLVRALIRLCRDLALAVTAEGVETPAQRDWLMRTGCTLAQGYLFGRPLPLEDALGLVRAERAGAERVVSHAGS